MQVNRRQKLRKRKGMTPREWPQQREHSLGVLAVPLIASQRGKAQQPERSQAVRGRCGVVEQILGAGHQRFAVAAGREEPALSGIPEQIEHRVGSRHGRVDPDRKSVV